MNSSPSRPMPGAAHDFSVEQKGPSQATSNTRTATGIGWTLTALATLFLVFDAVVKLVKAPEAVAGTVELGYSQGVLVTLGTLEVCCLLVYLWPRTSVLGAVLWTGYLGGAIATHVRVDNPLFSHVLFPVYVAVLLWGGLWLRDARLRRLFPLRRA